MYDEFQCSTMEIPPSNMEKSGPQTIEPKIFNLKTSTQNHISYVTDDLVCQVAHHELIESKVEDLDGECKKCMKRCKKDFCSVCKCVVCGVVYVSFVVSLVWLISTTTT
jgi:hypothetical protein